MRSIHVRSPTRVDLAGGTLDLWPLFLFVDQAVTVNLAIDIMTEALIYDRKENDDFSIEIESRDLQLKKKYRNLVDCLQDQDPQMKLFQEVLKYSQPEKGFFLWTNSQSPVGGGLGGSSSLIISLLKALSIFNDENGENGVNGENGGKAAFSSFMKIYEGRNADEGHKQRVDQNFTQIARIAHNLEAKILRTPTGTQDYFPALSGGINIIRYDVEMIEHKVISLTPDEFDFLNKHFLLLYTGRSHHSGLNNFDVLKKAVEGDKDTIKSLYILKELSLEMSDVVLTKKWDKIPDLFKEEYKARIQLAPSFSSPEIETLNRVSVANGAEAVKICGAGGGGCVLVWVTPKHREAVIKASLQEGIQVLNAHPIMTVPPPTLRDGIEKVG